MGTAWLFPYLLVCSRADPVRKDTAMLLPRRVPLDGLDGIPEPLATELSFCVGGGRILCLICVLLACGRCR